MIVTRKSTTAVKAELRRNTALGAIEQHAGSLDAVKALGDNADFSVYLLRNTNP